MTRRLILALFCCIVLAAASTSQAQEIEFVLTGNGGQGLLPSNVTPPTTSTGFGGEGDIGILFNINTNTLTIDIEWGSENGFGDLTGEITMLHFHGPTDDLPPSAFSQTGPLLINLGTSLQFDSSPTGGGLTDSYFISNADVPGILEGRCYINVHTAMYPNGEIRGYLVRADSVPEPGACGILGLLAIGASGFRRRRIS